MKDEQLRAWATAIVVCVGALSFYLPRKPEKKRGNFSTYYGAEIQVGCHYVNILSLFRTFSIQMSAYIWLLIVLVFYAHFL